MAQDDRRSAAARGYGARWRRERASYLALHPWCVTLGSECTLIGELIDHIQPHRGDERLFWDMLNWQTLCKHCHSHHKQLIEFGNAEVKRDHRGRLIVASPAK